MKAAITFTLIFLAAHELTAQPFLQKGLSESPSGNSIGDIIVLGDTVLVATGVGLSRSTDRGSSWTNFFNYGPFDDRGPSALAYSGGVIWMAVQTQVNQLDRMWPAGDGMQYSADGGVTWNYIKQPVDQKTDTVIIYGKNKLPSVPIHTIVGNLIWDIAVINNTVWIASWYGGLRKSSDYGKSWQRVIMPPDTLDSISPEDTLNFIVQSKELDRNQLVFSIAAVDSLTFYAGTAGGINKTTDGGKSWRKFNHLNQQKPISGNYVVNMKYSPLTKTLYACTWRADGSTESFGLSFTTDGGESWMTALEGERAYSTGLKGEDIIAATENGAFRSSNMGRSWILPGEISDKQSALSIKTKVFNSAASEGDDVWLGTNAGLVKLTEKGSMWNGDWRIYMTSQPLSSKSDSYAFPNPFSPDEEKVNIKYSTGGRRASVTIRIFDFGMNLVRTVIQNAERGSSQEDRGIIDYWDGRDEKGSIVPNGVYFYRIDFDQGEPLFGKIMVII